MEIEEFIEKVRADLFNNPGKKIWVKDNPERSEREALKYFRNSNKEENDKIIRTEDKCARLVIDSNERIIEETRKVLNDGKTFREETTHPTENHVKKVKEWRDKWKSVLKKMKKAGY